MNKFPIILGTHLGSCQPVQETSQARLQQCPRPRLLVVADMFRAFHVEDIIIVEIGFGLLPLGGLYKKRTTDQSTRYCRRGAPRSTKKSCPVVIGYPTPF